MIETSGGHTADIHAGSCANRFQAFQYLDAIRVILIGIDVCICHAVSYLSSFRFVQVRYYTDEKKAIAASP
jgi:hypothetical protein